MGFLLGAFAPRSRGTSASLEVKVSTVVLIICTLATNLIYSELTFAQPLFPQNYQWGEGSLLQSFQSMGSNDEFQVGSPLNNSDTYAGHDKFAGLNSFTEPVDDYGCAHPPCTATVVPDPSTPGETMSTSSQYLEGNKKSFPIAAMLPPTMGAISDNLWSPTATSIVNNQMSAATIVQGAAIALTEPAVMAGMDFAFRNAVGTHQAGLLTGIHATSLAQNMPTTREFITLYTECMQTYFEKVGLSFQEAQARCLRDAGLPSILTAQQGQVGGVPIQNMDYGDTSSYQAANPTALIANQKVGLLTDLLFNEQIYARYLPGQISHGNVDQLRKNFKKFIGDVRWTVDAHTTVSGGPITNRLQAKIDVVEPIWLAKDHLQLRTHERWDIMRTILYAYCDWMRNQSLIPTSNTGPTGVTPQTLWGDLYDISGYNIPGYSLRLLSTPGYTISPQEFDVLFAEVEREPLINQNCNFYFGDAATVLPYCPFSTLSGNTCVSPDTATETFTVLKLNGVPVTRQPYTGYLAFGGGTPTPIQRYINMRVAPNFGEKVPRLFRRMYFMARTLSRIEILQEGLISLNLLKNISVDEGVGVGGSLLADAQKLIFRAAQSTDIERSLVETTASLKTYLDNSKLELEREGASAVQAVGQLPQP